MKIEKYSLPLLLLYSVLVPSHASLKDTIDFNLPGGEVKKIFVTLTSLGKGEHGEVFGGYDGTDIFAVKYINDITKVSPIEADPSYSATFKFVAAPLATVKKNSKVVILYDKYETSPSPATFFSLKSLRYEAISILFISLHLSIALNSLHATGVVHNDIKPNNILFKDTYAFLSDLGCSEKTEEIPASPSIFSPSPPPNTDAPTLSFIPAHATCSTPIYNSPSRLFYFKLLETIDQKSKDSRRASRDDFQGFELLSGEGLNSRYSIDTPGFNIPTEAGTPSFPHINPFSQSTKSNSDKSLNSMTGGNSLGQSLDSPAFPKPGAVTLPRMSFFGRSGVPPGESLPSPPKSPENQVYQEGSFHMQHSPGDDEGKGQQDLTKDNYHQDGEDEYVLEIGGAMDNTLGERYEEQERDIPIERSKDIYYNGVVNDLYSLGSTVHSLCNLSPFFSSFSLGISNVNGKEKIWKDDPWTNNVFCSAEVVHELVIRLVSADPLVAASFLRPKFVLKVDKKNFVSSYFEALDIVRQETEDLDFILDDTELKKGEDKVGAEKVKKEGKEEMGLRVIIPNEDRFDPERRVYHWARNPFKTAEEASHFIKNAILSLIGDRVEVLYNSFSHTGKKHWAFNDFPSLLLNDVPSPIPNAPSEYSSPSNPLSPFLIDSETPPLIKASSTNASNIRGAKNTIHGIFSKSPQNKNSSPKVEELFAEKHSPFDKTSITERQYLRDHHNSAENRGSGEKQSFDLISSGDKRSSKLNMSPGDQGEDESDSITKRAPPMINLSPLNKELTSLTLPQKIQQVDGTIHNLYQQFVYDIAFLIQANHYNEILLHLNHNILPILSPPTVTNPKSPSLIPSPLNPEIHSRMDELLSLLQYEKPHPLFQAVAEFLQVKYTAAHSSAVDVENNISDYMELITEIRAERKKPESLPTICRRNFFQGVIDKISSSAFFNILDPSTPMSHRHRVAPGSEAFEAEPPYESASQVGFGNLSEVSSFPESALYEKSDEVLLQPNTETLKKNSDRQTGKKSKIRKPLMQPSSFRQPIYYSETEENKPQDSLSSRRKQESESPSDVLMDHSQHSLLSQYSDEVEKISEKNNPFLRLSGVKKSRFALDRKENSELYYVDRDSTPEQPIQSLKINDNLIRGHHSENTITHTRKNASPSAGYGTPRGNTLEHNKYTKVSFSGYLTRENVKRQRRVSHSSLYVPHITNLSQALRLSTPSQESPPINPSQEISVRQISLSTPTSSNSSLKYVSRHMEELLQHFPFFKKYQDPRLLSTHIRTLLSLQQVYASFLTLKRNKEYDLRDLPSFYSAYIELCNMDKILYAERYYLSEEEGIEFEEEQTSLCATTPFTDGVEKQFQRGSIYNVLYGMKIEVLVTQLEDLLKEKIDTLTVNVPQLFELWGANTSDEEVKTQHNKWTDYLEKEIAEDVKDKVLPLFTPPLWYSENMFHNEESLKQGDNAVRGLTLSKSEFHKYDYRTRLAVLTPMAQYLITLLEDLFDNHFDHIIAKVAEEDQKKREAKSQKLLHNDGDNNTLIC